MKFSDILRSIEIVEDEIGSKPTHASALLLWFSKPHADVHRVLELGSGTGVVSIGFVKIYHKEVVGVEIDEKMVEISRKSSQKNGTSEKTLFIAMDVADVPKRFKAEEFDMVVFNPPHFTGKIRSPDSSRALARSASEDLIEVFCGSTAWALRNRGEFAVVLHPENLMIWLEKLRAHRLEPKRMVFFHPKGKRAELVALRGRKNSKVGLIVDPPILEG